jgi:hypothetical protein
MNEGSVGVNPRSPPLTGAGTLAHVGSYTDDIRRHLPCTLRPSFAILLMCLGVLLGAAVVLLLAAS